LASDEVAIYSTEGFRRVAGFRGESFERPSRVSFAPGGAVVAVPVVQQGCLRVWDWSTSEDLAVLKEPLRANEAMFSPDGKFLLAHGADHVRLYQWDLAEEKLSLPRHAGGTPGAAFSPDGKRIASAGKDGMVRIWDSQTGQILDESAELANPAQCAAFSPDGRWLAVASFFTESIWIRDTLARRWALKIGSSEPGCVWVAQFSPDGRYLAAATFAGGTNDALKVWAINSHETPDHGASIGATLESSFAGQYWGLSFAPNGRRIGFADFGATGNLYIWDFLAAAAPRQVSSDRASYEQCEDFTPDSRRALFMDRKHDVVTVDADTGAQISRFPTLQSNNSPQISHGVNFCLSPDGSRVALSSHSGRGVDVWEVGTGRLLYSLPEQQGVVWWLAWRPDGHRLAVSRSDGDTSIWNLDAVERAVAELGLK
jgi:WD40 repeat protein